jgi:protein phosphatase PTC2/3
MRVLRSYQEPSHHQSLRERLSTPIFSDYPSSKLPFLIKGKQTFHHSVSPEPKSSRLPSVTKPDRFVTGLYTTAGLVRPHNEDTVKLVCQTINSKPVLFVGLYDGHGGPFCSAFLRENLHKYILEDSDLFSDPKSVLFRSFLRAENAFFEEAKKNSFDRSGSCAIVLLFVEGKCWVANLGDSRAVLSASKGSKAVQLSRDHKPADPGEASRVLQAGGYVYQSSNYSVVPPVLGPFRVFPGRLSVSRTIGDIHAKLAQYGGNPNVIISTPEVTGFALSREHDFLLVASDGLFDRLENREAVASAVEEFYRTRAMNPEARCEAAAKQLANLAIEKHSLDNITVVIIGLPSFFE